MTTVNMSFTTGTTVAVGTPYSAGVFDASTDHDPVMLTLTPVTTGSSTPAANVSTLYASLAGGEVDINQGTPLTAATDGSQTEFIYYESSDDDSGASTRAQKIAVNSKATVIINQLRAGKDVSLAAAHTALPSGSAGAAVQAAGGTWIVLPGTGAPTTIEAAANSLTWLEGAVFDGNLTITIDVDSGRNFYTTDVTLNGESAAFVNEAGANGAGFAVKGITAAALNARRTVNTINGIHYLVFH